MEVSFWELGDFQIVKNDDHYHHHGIIIVSDDHSSIFRSMLLYTMCHHDVFTCFALYGITAFQQHLRNSHCYHIVA